MRKHLALTAALLLGTAGAASAQGSDPGGPAPIAASASVRANVTVANAVAVTGETNFGTILNHAHDEVIDPTAPTATQSTARFALTGTPGGAVEISLTPSGCPITLSTSGSGPDAPKGGVSMQYSSRFAGSPTDNQSDAPRLALCQASLSATLSASGQYFLWLGGKLTVGANQLAGAYSGTQTISVTFN